MASGIMNYFGLRGREPVAEDKSPTRALPASWYTSHDMFELERRAIFSRKWMLITHKSRLSQPGDWLKFEVAGFEFILSHGRKEDTIHGFHNICRHRAFPVVQGKEGNARIFSCRYHGWSYGIDGKLAKAPKYDEFKDFDRSQNGLFPIHTRVDANGFVWVNLDAKEVPEVGWEDDFDGVDTQARFQQYNFDQYVLDHTFEMEGPYNWKILADNFNECYHCPTSHPDLPTLADIETHDVDGKDGWIRHQSKPTGEQEKKGLGIASSYFYPNASLSVLPHFIMLQRFLPSGPSKSTMHYQIFRNKNSSEEDFQLINKLYRQVMIEDKALCEQVQRNLNAGLFISGELHTRLEKGPLYFQSVNRKTIREHVEREKQAKHELWPARQNLPVNATVSKEDMEICSGLACQTNQTGLAW